MQSSAFFSLRVWGWWTPWLFFFFSLFRVAADHVLKTSTNSQVILCGLHFTNFLKAFSSRFVKRPGRDISLNDGTLKTRKDPWLFGKQTFQAVFVGVLLFLNSWITCRIIPFSFSLYRALDQRLNVMHIILRTKQKRSDEGTYQSGNFR